VAKAKSLLSEAGYPHGFSLTLTIPSTYGYATTAAPLIQAELAAIGIKTTIKDIEFPLWISQVFTDSDFQLTIIDHVEARDIAEYGDCQYYWKYAGCKAVQAMLAKATEATTPAAENAGFRAIIRKINADAVNDWLFNNDAVTVADSDVIGLPTGGESESFDLSQVTIGGTVSATAQSEGYSS
jgi:peptide/nickel transport system substrate-binding protein